jgi:hypothetical protein
MAPIQDVFLCPEERKNRIIRKNGCYRELFPIKGACLLSSLKQEWGWQSGSSSRVPAKQVWMRSWVQSPVQKKKKLALVAQACNPSCYSGGRGQEDCIFKPAWTNSLQDLILKIPNTKMGWQSSSSDTTSAWQVWDPEFRLFATTDKQTHYWQTNKGIMCLHGNNYFVY